MSNVFFLSVESAICIAIFYAFYIWVLRKDTFFKANRLFLIFSALFTLFLPLLSFNITLNALNGTSSHSTMLNATIESGINKIGAITIYGTKQNAGFKLIHVISGVYLTGVIIRFGMFITKFFQLFQKIKKADTQRIGKYSFVKTEETFSQIYSFFNFIFIHKDKLYEDRFAPAIEHEKIHARQLHSLDLIVIEMVSILQWYNPFIYLFRKMVVENHEFQTDCSVLKTPVTKENYLRMIMDQVINTHYISMTNAFSYSLSKKRLTMLTTMKASHKTAKIKYLGLVPLIAAMFLFFACSDETNETDQATEKQSEESREPGSKTKAKQDKDLYLKVEDMPVYKEGQGIKAFRQDIQRKLEYPEEAAKKNISGVVVLEFIVNKQGEITDPEVIKGAHTLLNEASMEAFEKMPNWEKAGKQNGETVNVIFNIPVVFKLK